MVTQGSRVHMLASVPVEDRHELLLSSGLDPSALKNFTLVHYEGNSAARAFVQTLPCEIFSSIMILADQELELSMMASDSQTLATLLLLRDIQQQREAEAEAKGQFIPRVCGHTLRGMPEGKMANMRKNYDTAFQTCPIICEILDARTQKTVSANASVCRTSEFVQSNMLVSQALAMVSENREVAGILKDFLGPGGTDLSLDDSSLFVPDEKSATFMDVAIAAQGAGRLILGYLEGASCTLNPTDKFKARYWTGVQWVTLAKSGTKGSAVTSGEMRAVSESPSASPAVTATQQFENMNDRMENIQTTVHQLAHVLAAFSEDKAEAAGKISSAKRKTKQTPLPLPLLGSVKHKHKGL
jgi:hypothetical protein